MIERDVEVSAVVEAEMLWNEFIEKLLEWEVAWQNFSDFVEENRLLRSEEFNMKVQRMLAKFGKQKFERMAPEFIGHIRGLGGASALKV